MQDLNNQTLTKRERKLLKRQQKEAEQLRSIKTKKTKRILVISLIAVVVIALVGWGAAKGFQKNDSSKNTSSGGTPRAELNEKQYDAGTISMAKGKAQHTYEIKNTGNGDLIINSIWTSCHCTTATMKIGDKKSAQFGMDKMSTNQKIAAGETGYLEVTFDPAYHGPSGVGAATRTIYLSTNDPQNKNIEVQFDANVTP